MIAHLIKKKKTPPRARNLKTKKIQGNLKHKQLLKKGGDWGGGREWGGGVEQGAEIALFLLFTINFTDLGVRSKE